MTQPRLIPLEQFFDNPERALAKPSPDGTMLSWLAPLDGLLNVWVRPIGGGEAEETVYAVVDLGLDGGQTGGEVGVAALPIG